MPEDNIEALKKEVEELRKKLNEKGEKQKKGMIEKASKGEVMSRAPFGYLMENGQLIPAQNYNEVEDIFNEFLNEKISLNKLADKHNFSVNGLKKILTNFTYIGKVKFSNQIHQGNHKPIISTTLFNHVQNKLENLGIK